MNKHNLTRILLLIILLSTIPSACSPPNTEWDQNGPLEGTITISGAWALYPLVVRWGEEFQKIHPAVRFDISAGGAGKGMADALANAVDIGMVSREIYPQETEQGAFWVSVAKDAVFLTVNDQNPVWGNLQSTGITREKIIDIYLTGKITNWGEIAGRTEITAPIHIFTRSDACGAAATWAKFLGQYQEDLLGIGVYGDPGVLESVIKDPLGIGFNNLSYAYDFETGAPVTGIHIVPLDINNNGEVDPEEIIDIKEQALEAVSAGYYPSPPARDLNLVTKGSPQGLVREFISWILSEGQIYVREAGFIPISQDKLEKEILKLDE
ncbi:MAG: substrate-binding domain-containing protein [Anaerolineales bacterium]|nr:substrate-binding domain-containing protein [Anaerolineales bacterium]